MEDVLIFGAKSLALGACLAMEKLYPQYRVRGFVVSRKEGNPASLHGLPVMELGSIEKKDTLIYIATPEDVQEDIIETLECGGFHRYVRMDSGTESELMGKYYQATQEFPLLETCGKLKNVHGFMAKHWKDRPLSGKYKVPLWIEEVQAGAALTDVRVARLTDDTGDNISEKNGNYCELTALYWLWKNVVSGDEAKDSYYGMFQYRRLLKLRYEELIHLNENDIDVILPYPTVCEPGIYEHHERYVSAYDWEAMLAALAELQPEYREAFDNILRQKYMYNYNIILARKEVLSDYCAWLFPILARTEELSAPKGCERADRYIGYLAESLLTLYFMYHRNDMNIVHTGRIMLT